MGDYEKQRVISLAEEALSAEIPQLYATQYIRFVRDGNRSEYENPFFARRTMLRTLTLGEMAERKGRFIDKIIDVAWLICEETTWVIPPHNHVLDKGGHTPLTLDVRDETHVIDIFSAETGAELANTLYHLRDALDAVSPSVSARIDYCLEKNILTPFEKYLYWWGGFTDGSLENWNPWIISNVLFTVGVEVKDHLRRAALCDKALIILDRFVNIYAIDGGCDEGPRYWTHAAASLFDCMEMLYDLTGGSVDFFDSELIRNMCDYFRKAYISGEYVMNFADAPAVLGIADAARCLNRMARRTHNPELAAFASYAAYRGGAAQAPYTIDIFHCCRGVRDLYETIPPYTGGGVCVSADFHGISVAVRRETAEYDKGLYFAIKGGTNGENHNHNDVGSFVVYKDGQPVIIDIGVGTYTRKTFSPERYTIPSMRSAYHSVAQFGRTEQQFGVEYACKNPMFTEDGLSADIEDAYPEGSGLLRYNRSGTLHGDTVTVCDTLSLTAPTKVTWNFLCRKKPVLKGNTAVIGNATLFFPEVLTPGIDPFVFDDPFFVETWKCDCVYRLQLTAELTEGAFTFLIR